MTTVYRYNLPVPERGLEEQVLGNPEISVTSEKSQTILTVEERLESITKVGLPAEVLVLLFLSLCWLQVHIIVKLKHVHVA